MTKSGTIRAGMGGWTFEPWDTSFYPEKLPKAKQLQYASRQVPTIEVNGTYYSSFKEPTFVKWASETPDGFVYSLKGNRFVTNRRVLGEAGESMMRFLGSGIAALGEKLGPILWQFAPTKKFDPDDFEAFLKLLPEKQDGVTLRHTVEVRHASFVVPEFVALARKYDVPWSMPTMRPTRPSPTSPATSSMRGCRPARTTSRPAMRPKALDEWADRAKIWAQGGAPDDLPRADPANEAPVKPRDVFVYFITSGKVHAPQGAMAFMERI